jgi:hypothetical protein
LILYLLQQIFDTKMSSLCHQKYFFLAGGMAQVVEHLHRKSKALSSNPNMAKNFFSWALVAQLTLNSI